MDSPRILIIDDDPNLRKTLADILKLRGFRPYAVGNGADGLAWLENNSASLVLIDLGLPDIFGIEVLKKVKAAYPATEIIVLTGKATLDSAIEATNWGAFSYLVKPYEIEQLILNIRRAIEKQQAEDALRESEECFRKIFEESPLGMAIIDRNNRFVKVNNMLCRMLGYTEAELISLNYTDIIHFVDMKENVKHIRQLFKRKLPYWKTEKRCIKKSGELFWVNMTASVILDAAGDTRWFLKMFEDITKRKKAEQVIIGAKEEWERTFDAITDPIMIVDTGHRIVKANKAMTAKMGAMPSAAGQSKCYQIFHGMDAPPPFCPHSQLMADGRPHSVETYVDSLGGDFLVVVSPLFGPDGKLQGSIHFARDITERKSLEKQLRHAQKMEAIGTLAGGIAHDFNNILTAITGYANLLEMDMSMDDQQAAYLEGILSGAERAANLTRSLLAFSRKQEIELKPTDLNTVVVNVEKMLRRLIREDIELSTSLCDEELTVLADASQIEQILMNFTANARDAILENGMIMIGTRVVALGKEFRVIHGFGEPGRYVLLTFSDTGTGIDEQTRQRIFEPFFTTKEVGKGTGLGLSVAYGIIKQHNGYITCYSEPGNGTTFRVYLPLIGGAAEQSKSAPDILLPKGTETLLLAEDDAMTRRLCRLLLENSGYKVIEAANGEEAVAQLIALKDEIRLVLIDVIMPRMNGREAFRRMEQIRPGIKAIFISGYTADIFHKKEIFEEGINFLSKPLSHKELLVTVRNQLDS
jgi:two-component system cell cycle sensor histidine kinase/response regulator CckA